MRLGNAGETEALGARLADALRAATSAEPRGRAIRGLVYLEGQLGAGKTTLARGLILGLGFAGPVKSPTYTLVEPYVRGPLAVYHFDLYRLGDPEELEYLGARDYFAGEALCLVEWPERAAGWLPPADLHLRLSVAGEGRRVEATPRTPLGERLGAVLTGSIHGS